MIDWLAAWTSGRHGSCGGRNEGRKKGGLIETTRRSAENQNLLEGRIVERSKQRQTKPNQTKVTNDQTTTPESLVCALLLLCLCVCMSVYGPSSPQKGRVTAAPDPIAGPKPKSKPTTTTSHSLTRPRRFALAAS